MRQNPSERHQPILQMLRALGAAQQQYLEIAASVTYEHQADARDMLFERGLGLLLDRLALRRTP